MNIESRLKKLERASGALWHDTHEGARERFWAILTATAQRLEGTQPDEGWCTKASTIQIAAMAMLENASGASTPALWAKVKDLAGPDTASQKLLAGLEAAHGED